MAHTDGSVAITVHAFADTSGRGKSDWTAHTIYPKGHPVAGLFAAGQSVSAASEALAQTVWMAVASGAVSLGDVSSEKIGAVQVFTTTRKTFGLEKLKESVA